MKDGFKVIDADRHVLEPTDLFARYLPEKFRSRVEIKGPNQSYRLVDGEKISDADQLRDVTKQEDFGFTFGASKRWRETFAEALAAKFDPASNVRDMDKEGVKLAVMAGTSAEESAKKSFTKAEIVSITAPALDYQELLAGRVTAAITDTVFIRKALAQYETDFAVVDVDHPIEGQPISMMTIQGDQVWLNWVNTWIKLKQQTGFFDSLFNKWIAG